MKRNSIILIICTLLIILWGYAALSKWSAFKTFGFQLNRQPLPLWSIPLLKWGLPVVEITTVILLYFQRTRLIGFLESSILMISFTGYVAIVLSGAFGRIPCACAGLISSLKWRGHLIFNIVFTVISCLGLYLEKHKDDRFVKHRPITT